MLRRMVSRTYTTFSGVRQTDLNIERQTWMLRGSHENTFLSWTRNSLISTLLGTQLFAYQHSEVADAAFCIGGLCMIKGCGGFAITAFRLREALGLSTFGLAWCVTYAGLKASLWVGCVGAIKGYWKPQLLPKAGTETPTLTTSKY